MTSSIIPGLSTTAQSLLNNEAGFITQSGALITTGTAAVTMSGASNLTVLGAVGQSASGGLINGTVTLPTIVVGESGFIGNLDNTAISLSLSDSLTLENEGTIRGETSALSVTASDAAATVNLTNSGSIAGGTSTAISVTLGTGQLNLINSGDITSPGGAIFLGSGSLRLTNTGTIADISEGLVISTMASANDLIINTGSIVGDVDLGGGDDVYDGSNGGTIIGVIDLDAGNDIAFGGNGRETFVGGAGDDEVSGGGGDDAFTAGQSVAGNDGNDLFDGGDGMDSYVANLSNLGVVIDLAQGFASGARIGFDTLISIERAVGTNNADTIIGDDGNNFLSGLNGVDTLIGGDGIDRMNGGGGNDLITGGGGRDVMTGGLNSDVFNYLSESDSGVTSATRDRITDFTAGQDDIDISALGGTFTFIANAAFSGGNQVRFQTAGLNTLVEIDTDGDQVAEMAIVLNGVVALTANEFVL